MLHLREALEGDQQRGHAISWVPELQFLDGVMGKNGEGCPLTIWMHFAAGELEQPPGRKKSRPEPHTTQPNLSRLCVGGLLSKLLELAGRDAAKGRLPKPTPLELKARPQVDCAAAKAQPIA